MVRVLVAMVLSWQAAGASAAAVELSGARNGFRAEAGEVAIEGTRNLGIRVFIKKDAAWASISAPAAVPAVSVVFEDGRRAVFELSGQPVKHSGVRTQFGDAGRVLLKAAEPGGMLRLELSLDFPARYPGVVIATSTLTNPRADRPVSFREVTQGALSLAGEPGATAFWSLQGGAYKWGDDFILPVQGGFSRDNYTGPKGGGNGGGLPLVDLWRPGMGVALALLDPKPVLAWLPVEVGRDGLAQVRVTTRPAVKLPPGAAYTPAPVMIAVHTGDFYDGMVRYRQLMGDLGIRPVSEYEPADYEPAWCTWGYERKFTMQEVLAKLPQMQEMRMTDFILDDGWFDLFGNWRPTRAKFPNGDADMKSAIAKIHAAGRRFRLWWSPGSADPGSDIDRNHPEWFILDRSGKREKASWNAYYLCPAYPPVRQAMLELVRHFITDWSTDAFKLDGTDLNHAPLCYNQAHHHARPEESFEQWPELMVQIRNEARRLRPGFRIELCPCGMTPTFQLAMAMEQPTDSDPLVHQVTSRTKFLKAMFGPRAPVLQEYVGVSVIDAARKPSGVDIYPRAIGTGEVISTFTTKLGEANARWTAIYNRHRPAEGEYLNLYDIGWERVEGHVIRKADKLYYGFFSRKPGTKYEGPVEVRGLMKGRYRLTDYVHGSGMGLVEGPAATVRVSFTDALLLVAEPVR